jgi:TatD DNase family protein
VEFFDSHAHVALGAFGGTQVRRARLQRSVAAGVTAVLAPAVGPADGAQLPDVTRACHAETGVALYYALGLHPWALAELDEASCDRWLAQVEDRVAADVDPRLRAVGECGLDFGVARDATQRGRQLTATRRQLELARRTGRPAVLHCVRAHAALIALLDERATPACVLHSFSGSAEIAREYQRRGHYVSFSGSVCRPRIPRLASAVRAVAIERLLVETDSPDQTPWSAHPAVNEPGFLPLVAARVAELRAEPLEAIAAATRHNARVVFGIEDSQ